MSSRESNEMSSGVSPRHHAAVVWASVYALFRVGRQQDGGSPREAADRQSPLGPLEDHDIRRRGAPQQDQRALCVARSHEWPELPDLSRNHPGAELIGQRHRRHGQSPGPQGRRES